MTWTIKFNDDAKKQFKKLDKSIANRIIRFMSERLMESKNPRVFGDALKGSLSGLWKYRIGNYRLLCHIDDNTVTILVISVGHRKDIYK